MESIRMWRTAAVAALLALVLTACGQAVAGVPRVGDGGCVPAADDASPSTPTGAPVITVDDRVSFWVPNAHTAPLGLTVYAEGTVISAEGNGSHAEPLTPMTIGLVDGCDVQRAVDALVALAHADFGMPGITDQGVTTVTVTRPGSEPVILSAYALGIGDEYVDRAQAAARASLASTLDGIEDATSAVQPWVPDRLQLTRFEYDDPGPAQTWPLAGSIADLLPQRTYGYLACGVVDGADADAIAAALGDRPALSQWADGRDTATLAVGVLVPGQPACAG
jgi:hypothetical protein